MSFWDDVGDAVSSAGDAVASAASAVGDAVEGAADAVADGVDGAANSIGDAIAGAVDGVVDWANNNLGGFLGAIASILGGVVTGIIHGLQDLVHAAATLVKDAAGVSGSILRLDFAGALSHLIDFGIDLVGAVLVLVRWASGGYIVGGIVHQFERRALRDFVEQLLRDTFGDRPGILSDIRSRLNLDGISWGLTFNAQHKVFMLR